MKTLILLVLSLFSLEVAAQNNLIQLSGQLIDKVTEEPIYGGTIKVKETNAAAISDFDGKFVLKTQNKFPFTLEIVISGYEKVEFVVENEKAPLSFQLDPQVIVTDEVVVTASRVSESVIKSPVAIDKLDITAIRETPAPTFYDALENVKGVQMTTSSLNFKVPNTRGFNSPNNFRFMQLVDGVDLQAPTLGVSIGNAMGPNELDVLSVEIIPGTSSALYGINSINGLANIQTKSPYTKPGIGFYQRLGINHVDGKDYDPSVLTESAFRIAGTFGKTEKWAYKINASYFRGTDWASTNGTDQNTYALKSSNPKFPQFDSPENNPAYDAWNRYGDERNNNVTVQVTDGNGSLQTFNVRRTGYWEKDLINPIVSNTRFDGSLYYRFNETSLLSYTYRLGSMDGVFQRGNKIQLNDVLLQSHLLDFSGKNLSVKLYVNSENTGNSYNLKPLADNLDLTFRSNSSWKSLYQSSLQAAINGGVDWTSAHQQARRLADAGRPESGSAEFQNLVQTITGINNWDHASLVNGAPATGGAALWQRSRMYHGEVQYNLTDKINKFANVLIGVDARVYEVIPDGNNFVDLDRPIAERSLPGGNNVYYSKFGGFVQAGKEFFEEKLKVVASLRYDKNLDFEGKWNPRLAVVYSPTKTSAIRLSVQNGFRFPSLFEALSYVNNGNVRRVGGLAKVNEGLGYLENSYTLTSVDAFNAAINADVAAGMTKPDAILKNKGLLVVADLPTLQPEQVKAFDLGYKSVFPGNKVVVDLDVYFNIFNGFLGQVEVAVPKTDVVGTDSSAFDMTDRNKQVRYRVYTNSRNTYYSYGSALRLSYNFYKLYSLSGNVSFNDFNTEENNDVFVTAFNTPRWSASIQFGNREIVKNFGFNIVWKWQAAFDWQSPLANGRIPAYQTIDAQVSYKIPRAKTVVKVGGTNVFNKRYFQYAAGPTVGALYYISLTFDAGFEKRKSEE